MQSRATVVITDSGGIQEETTYLGVPCLTLPREHRAPGHGFPGNERSRRTRSRQTALRTLAHPRRPGEEGNHPSSLGRSRGRTHRCLTCRKDATSRVFTCPVNRNLPAAPAMECKHARNIGVPAGHVNVWRVRLDEAADTDSEASVLSPDEIARASRFHFEKDRIYFTRCRSALRHLLCRLPENSCHRDPFRVSDRRQAAVRSRAESTCAPVQRIALGKHGADRSGQ